MKKILSVLLICCALFPVHSVLAASADTSTLPVLSRGHIQDLGDYPADGSWVESPKLIGTVGQSKRIEGFELKAGDNLPADLELRYNVHIQNIGWLDGEDDPSSWAKNGDYAGTRGDGLRIEAIKIVLLDATGNKATDYHVRYQGHVENVGDLPTDASKWYLDGEQLGTVGSSLRLEALKLEIVKEATATVYDKPGSYGPSSGSEKISQDVIITSDGVTLQNLVIEGNLTIDEAVGDGDVTLNNVTVTGALQVRGGGKNSIHINGGKYAQILVEQAPDGGVRIVATGIDGVPVVLSENAAGETLILEGAFDSVTVNAPDAVIKTQGQTSIKTVDVGGAAENTAIELGSTTTVTNLTLSSPTKVTGTGTVSKAEIASDNVSFEKAPQDYTVEPDVVVPPVIPTPTPQPQPGGGSGGYTPPAKINLIVATPATVTTAKTYDGTTTANITGQPSVTGIVANDDVQVVATASYDNKNAGNNKDITISYNLSGAAASKYNPPAATTVTGEITQKPLSSATTAITKEFDGTTTLNSDITENLGQLASDTLTITRTATYQNSSGNTDAIEVGTDKPVTCSYTLSGADAENYLAPADSTATGTITKKNLTVSAASLNINKSKTYDGTNKVFNTEGDSEITKKVISVATGVAADPNINVKATAVYDNQNVDSNRTIRVSYTIDSSPANNRYQIAATETIGASITARQLTITAPTPVAKAYDGTAEVFTEASNIGKIYNMPITPGNIVATDAGKVTVTATAIYDGGKDVGPNKNITIHYTLAGEAAGNYQPLSDDHSKTADITPLSIATTPIVNDSDKIKEYDGTSKALVTVRVTDTNQIPIVQDALTNGTLAFDTTAVYQDNNSETSNVGSGYTIAYTYKLSGTTAHNFSLSGAASDGSITGTISGGSITAKKLTVSVADLGLQTEKTYDGNASTNVSSKIITGSNGLTGIVGTEKVTATVSSCYSSVDAGDRSITTSFTLSGDYSGDDSGNYCIDSLSSNGKIKPIQLTVDNTKLPAIAATRKYDATTDVYLTDATKLSDYPLAADAVSGLINSEAVTVKATANYDNKDVGENIPITITYSLSEEAAKNYLAPAPDTSKTAAITARILGYSNVNLDTIKKYKSGDSSVTVNRAEVDPTTSNGMDGIVHIDGNANNLLEDVNLATYSADYYDGDQKTSAVGSNYDIKLSGSLTGNHASNYLMTDHAYSSNGQILDANAIISTPYNNTAWTPAGNLTPPADVTNFKLFYAKQNGATTFYGYDDNGKIYSSTDLSNWIAGAQVTLDDSKQLIGVDSSGNPIAIATTPDTDQYTNTSHPVYSWSGSSWSSNDSLTNIHPSNPTYYTDGTSEYLIYQDDGNYAYSLNLISNSSPTPIDASSGPTLPGGFTNSLLVYNGGSDLMLYAY
ncbi:MAG: YDG domain-containing protein [Acetobacterium sp.]|uniref:YDG domain-containing protein n=1 Tax=Acetobacterium sp. TaxID=1872094 RepID=UPI0032429C1A